MRLTTKKITAVHFVNGELLGNCVKADSYQKVQEATVEAKAFTYKGKEYFTFQYYGQYEVFTKEASTQSVRWNKVGYAESSLEDLKKYAPLSLEYYV